MRGLFPKGPSTSISSAPLRPEVYYYESHGSSGSRLVLPGRYTAATKNYYMICVLATDKTCLPFLGRTEDNTYKIVKVNTLEHLAVKVVGYNEQSVRMHYHHEWKGQTHEAERPEITEAERPHVPQSHYW